MACVMSFERSAIVDLAVILLWRWLEDSKKHVWSLQSASEQRPHKLSYHVSVKGSAAEKAVSELESKLKAAGL